MMHFEPIILFPLDKELDRLADKLTAVSEAVGFRQDAQRLNAPIDRSTWRRRCRGGGKMGRRGCE